MALHTIRITLASFWMGVIVALGFVETPLKFLAPGVTLEIALGIGRLVLTAADIIGLVLLCAITALAVPRPRPTRAGWGIIAAMWLVLLAQVLLIRPPLNARTDIILAGGDPGESALHVFYIAAHLILLLLLLAHLVVTARRAAAVQSTRESSVAGSVSGPV